MLRMLNKKKATELSICAVCCDNYHNCRYGQYYEWSSCEGCEIEIEDILTAIERGDLKIRRSIIRKIKRGHRKWYKKYLSPDSVG